MFTFLLVVQAIVAAAMIAVILMQKSEGGGLGVGGSPSGLLSARGAADFLTRSTAILAAVFVALSIALATIASVNHGGGEIDTSLSTAAKGGAGPAPSMTGPAPATDAPATGAAPALPGTTPADDPLAAAAAAAAGNAPAAAPEGVPLER